MGTPASPVTLSAEQVEELSRKFSTLRHDINNHLSLIVAAAELIKCNPTLVPRMTVTLGEQPPKISEAMNKFSADFDQLLGIRRG